MGNEQRETIFELVKESQVGKKIDPAGIVVQAVEQKGFEMLVGGLVVFSDQGIIGLLCGLFLGVAGKNFLGQGLPAFKIGDEIPLTLVYGLRIPFFAFLFVGFVFAVRKAEFLHFGYVVAGMGAKDFVHLVADDFGLQSLVVFKDRIVVFFLSHHPDFSFFPIRTRPYPLGAAGLT
jgi:hypothetical protein